MDVLVTRAPDGDAWRLTDLLGRAMGTIAQRSVGRFVIKPEGQALDTFAAIADRSFPSLDAALAEIETHTRGVCRRAEGERS